MPRIRASSQPGVRGTMSSPREARYGYSPAAGTAISFVQAVSPLRGRRWACHFPRQPAPSRTGTARAQGRHRRQRHAHGSAPSPWREPRQAAARCYSASPAGDDDQEVAQRVVPLPAAGPPSQYFRYASRWRGSSQSSPPSSSSFRSLGFKKALPDFHRDVVCVTGNYLDHPDGAGWPAFLLVLALPAAFHTRITPSP